MEEKEEEEVEEFQKRILELCETDPDAGLEYIRKLMSEKPVLESYPFLKWCKARAYQFKGVQPLRDRPFVNVGIAGPDELRLYVNDENLNYIELALLEIRQTEDIDLGFMRIIEEHVDGMACVLERCRPGRVQQILGKTKLTYFGVDRISTVPHVTDKEKLPPEKLRPFLDIFFSFPSVIKSALVYYAGRDAKGREYISCMLFGKLFDDLEPDETYEDAKVVGEIYLFNDGTFAHTLEEERKAEEKEEPRKEEEPKKKSFFKKFRR